MREDGSRILPILALNEVFIGESLSSRVSYLELQVSVCCSSKNIDLLSSSCFKRSSLIFVTLKVDQQQSFKTRNSGLCIATGTGEEDCHLRFIIPTVSNSSELSFIQAPLAENSIIIHSGSTSWIFNVNKMAHHAVESLLKITFETTRSLAKRNNFYDKFIKNPHTGFF